jgi:hypothetical protein
VFQSFVLKRCGSENGETITVDNEENTSTVLSSTYDWRIEEPIGCKSRETPLIIHSSFSILLFDRAANEMSAFNKHRRDVPSTFSRADKVKLVIREAYQTKSVDEEALHNRFDIDLYEHDRQDRIDQIADDDDGDLIIERRIPMETDQLSRVIEANDRRHDAVIFGDKQMEGSFDA